MEGNEFWNYSCGGNINSLSISRDSSTLVAGSDAGAAYLFERNSTAFALLLGDESFLSQEDTQESDTIKAGETGLPLKEGTAMTGGVENIVEIASASTGKAPVDIKNNENSAVENSASAKSSPKLLEFLDFFKFPIALLFAVLVVAFYLKKRTFKKQTLDGDFKDFENLEEENNRPEN